MKYQWHIFLASLNPAKGSEQSGGRPVLVISRESINEILPVVNVIGLAASRCGRAANRLNCPVLPNPHAGQEPAGKGCERTNRCETAPRDSRYTSFPIVHIISLISLKESFDRLRDAPDHNHPILVYLLEMGIIGDQNCSGVQAGCSMNNICAFTRWKEGLA